MVTDFITVREAARLLSTSKQSVIRLCRSGKIAYNQDGKWFRVRLDSLKLYIHNTFYEQKKLEQTNHPGHPSQLKK